MQTNHVYSDNMRNIQIKGQFIIQRCACVKRCAKLDEEFTQLKVAAATGRKYGKNAAG